MTAQLQLFAYNHRTAILLFLILVGLAVSADGCDGGDVQPFHR